MRGEAEGGTWRRLRSRSPTWVRPRRRRTRRTTPGRRGPRPGRPGGRGGRGGGRSPRWAGRPAHRRPGRARRRPRPPAEAVAPGQTRTCRPASASRAAAASPAGPAPTTSTSAAISPHPPRRSGGGLVGDAGALEVEDAPVDGVVEQGLAGLVAPRWPAAARASAPPGTAPARRRRRGGGSRPPRSRPPRSRPAWPRRCLGLGQHAGGPPGAERGLAGARVAEAELAAQVLQLGQPRGRLPDLAPGDQLALADQLAVGLVPLDPGQRLGQPVRAVSAPGRTSVAVRTAR